MGDQQRPRVLRIGVVQGGKIIEERIVRGKQPVTVGTATGNDVLVSGQGCPKRHALFEQRGDGAWLVFTAGMDGKVSVGEAATDLEALVAQGLAAARGGTYRLKLNPASRGRVRVGDAVILFQFVVPPPVPAAPRLPISMRSGLLAGLDWGFSSVLACVGLFFFAVVAVARQAPLPPEPTIEDLPVRIVSVVMPDKYKDGLPEDKEDGPGEKPPEPKAKPKPKPKPADAPGADEVTEGPEAKAREAANERERMVKKVSKRGLIGIIGTKGKGGLPGDSAVGDIFRDGSIDSGTKTAFEGMGGYDLAMNEERPDPRRPDMPGDDGPIELEDMGTEGVVGPERGPRVKREARVEAELTIPEPEPFDPGERDRQAIKAKVRRRLGAIRRCYEGRLKLLPELRGKVVVRFVIHPGGQVVEAEVMQNTTGDGPLAQCVRSRVLSIRFGAVDGAETEVTYPFLMDVGK